MEKGSWFASPKKTMFTLLNVFSISVGMVLVSSFAIILFKASSLPKVTFSASLAYIALANPSTIIRAVPVFLVRTIHDVHYQ